MYKMLVAVRWQQRSPNASVTVVDSKTVLRGSVDSMETLLLHENVKQDMGRKRPTDFTCHRARSVEILSR